MECNRIIFFFRGQDKREALLSKFPLGTLGIVRLDTVGNFQGGHHWSVLRVAS